MTLSRRHLLAAGATLPLAAPSLALAQTKEFRLGILTPGGHPWNRAALKVGADLKAATNGRLTMTVFHSGQLGNEAAMLQQMQSGALDMGWIMAAELGSRVPTIAAITAPYIVDSTPKIAKLVRDPVAMKLFDVLPRETGTIGLAWGITGMRAVFSTRDISRVADIRGMKLRINPTPVYRDFYQALGAAPTPIPTPQVFDAMTNGQVDGLEALRQGVEVDPADERGFHAGHRPRLGPRLADGLGRRSRAHHQDGQGCARHPDRRARRQRAEARRAVQGHRHPLPQRQSGGCSRGRRRFRQGLAAKGPDPRGASQSRRDALSLTTHLNTPRGRRSVGPEDPFRRDTMAPRISWEGVFPAVTTQFHDDLSLDIDATARVMDNLIRDGVSGLIVCGSVGENTSLERREKIQIMETAKAVAAGRVPVLCGIAEFTTAFAVETAKEAARIGIDGVMVMPALVYSSKPHETAAHFRSVATATDLPVMLYNNPPIYKNDVTPDILVSLADVDTVVCFKDSSGDTRRFIDTRNMVGDRFVLFAGLDDVIVESVAMGAVGWVSGMSNAFPREGETLFRLARAGRYAEAMPLYEWFMPLLHLDARPDLVQCIKLCENIMGRGTALTRPPRLALLPHEKAEVEAMMAKALKSRPKLPEVGLKIAA
jgi:dihydrodipicolinate synthase/N-acetylneuraminate lyase